MGKQLSKFLPNVTDDWRDLFRESYGHGSKAPQAVGLKAKGENFDGDFELLDLLGTGTFSQVFKARHKPTHTCYAVKAVSFTAKTGVVDMENKVKQEIWILQSLDHPSIVTLYSVYQEPTRCMMVLELMEGGELFERIVAKSTYNESEARDLIRIVLGALTFMHSKHIVHRDLKPENLLLLSKSNDYQVKIADFGFARSVQHGLCTESIGTPGYVAPEVISRKPYSLPADVWSVGVIFFILLSGHAPFHDPNQQKLYRKIRTGSYSFNEDDWYTVSDEAKDLVRRMLTVNQTSRITAQEALTHAWFVGKRHRPDLMNRNLTSNLHHLRVFNARRKLQAAVRSVLFAKRMNVLLGDENQEAIPMLS